MKAQLAGKTCINIDRGRLTSLSLLLMIASHWTVMISLSLICFCGLFVFLFNYCKNVLVSSPILLSETRLTLAIMCFLLCHFTSSSSPFHFWLILDCVEFVWMPLFPCERFWKWWIISAFCDTTQQQSFSLLNVTFSMCTSSWPEKCFEWACICCKITHCYDVRSVINITGKFFVYSNCRLRQNPFRFHLSPLALK